MRLDIVSDAICPWCWIGKRHLEAALAMLADDGLRLDVAWLPYQLNPDMPPEGAGRRAYRTRKFGTWERAQELDAQVTGAARVAGLDFRLDLLERTPNTLAAHRLIWLAGRQGVQDAAVETLFRAYFTEGRDIGDRAVLTACAEQAGVSGAAAMLDGEDGLAEVQDAERAARTAGIDGVPSFFLDGHFLFSGAVPPEKMRAALARGHRIISSQAA